MSDKTLEQMLNKKEKLEKRAGNLNLSFKKCQRALDATNTTVSIMYEALTSVSEEVKKVKEHYLQEEQELIGKNSNEKLNRKLLRNMAGRNLTKEKIKQLAANSGSLTRHAKEISKVYEISDENFLRLCSCEVISSFAEYLVNCLNVIEKNPKKKSKNLSKKIKDAEEFIERAPMLSEPNIDSNMYPEGIIDLLGVWGTIKGYYSVCEEIPSLEKKLSSVEDKFNKVKKSYNRQLDKISDYKTRVSKWSKEYSNPEELIALASTQSLEVKGICSKRDAVRQERIDYERSKIKKELEEANNRLKRHPKYKQKLYAFEMLKASTEKPNRTVEDILGIGKSNLNPDKAEDIKKLRSLALNVKDEESAKKLVCLTGCKLYGVPDVFAGLGALDEESIYLLEKRDKLVREKNKYK